MARPPASLPPTSSSSLSVELFVGSFVHSPLQAYLFDLVLPPSYPTPKHPEESHYHVKPEIQHIFRPDPTSPPKFISAVFTGVVLAPWAVLALLVRPFLQLLAIVVLKSYPVVSDLYPSAAPILFKHYTLHLHASHLRGALGVVLGGPQARSGAPLRKRTGGSCRIHRPSCAGQHRPT